MNQIILSTLQNHKISQGTHYKMESRQKKTIKIFEIFDPEITVAQQISSMDFMDAPGSSQQQNVVGYIYAGFGDGSVQRYTISQHEDDPNKAQMSGISKTVVGSGVIDAVRKIRCMSVQQPGHPRQNLVLIQCHDGSFHYLHHGKPDLSHIPYYMTEDGKTGNQSKNTLTVQDFEINQHPENRDHVCLIHMAKNTEEQFPLLFSLQLDQGVWRLVQPKNSIIHEKQLYSISIDKTSDLYRNFSFVYFKDYIVIPQKKQLACLKYKFQQTSQSGEQKYGFNDQHFEKFTKEVSNPKMTFCKNDEGFQFCYAINDQKIKSLSKFNDNAQGNIKIVVDEQIVEISWFDDYLLVFRLNDMCAYNLKKKGRIGETECDIIVSLPRNPKHHTVSTQNGRFKFFSQLQEGDFIIKQLYLKPYEEQIKFYLECEEYDQAESVLGNLLLRNDQGQIQKIHLQFGWYALLKHKKFEKALHYFKKTKFDIREIITTCGNALSLPLDDVLKNLSIQIRRDFRIQLDQNDLRQQLEEKKTLRIQLRNVFLLPLLKHKREELLQISESAKVQCIHCHDEDIPHEPMNTLVRYEITVAKALQIVDWLIICIYIDQWKEGKIRQSVTDLKNFFAHNDIHINKRTTQAFLQDKLLTFKHYLDQWRNEHGGEISVEEYTAGEYILAGFYMTIGKYDEATELWITIFEKAESQQDQGMTKVAVRKLMEKLLRDLDKEVRIKEVFRRMLLKKRIREKYKKYIEIGFRHTKLEPDKMLVFLNGLAFEGDQEDDQLITKKSYQITYLQEKKEDLKQKRHGTQLCFLYIDMLKNYKRNNNIQQYKPFYTQFKGFLTEHSNFNAQQIFGKIVAERQLIELDLDQFRIQPLILELYTKLGRHSDVIEAKLEHDDFAGAEKYCEEQKVLTMLFEKYVEGFQRYEGGEDLDEEDEKRRQLYHQLINEFLIKFMNHEQVNPQKIIEKMPDNFKLQDPSLEVDAEEENEAFFFLENMISHQVTEKRSRMIMKNLYEVDEINSTAQLIEREKAYVIIGDGTKCDLCSTKLNAKSSFYVFPNGVVVLEECFKKISKVNVNKELVCPVTGEDFMLKFDLPSYQKQ